ncbi:MAG TPA: pitrilysin family protein [Steroidobacteraceae bacterium]|jgi:zinc protease
MRPRDNLPARRTRRALLSGALLLLTTASVAAGAAQSDIQAADRQSAEQDVLRDTLPNGLRVIIVRNRLAPVVATAVNYLVGSDEAASGFPGMAHAQEHMMFRGTPGLTTEQLANISAVMGGNFNANTRESITQYLFTVPSQDLDVALHIEAQRMQGVVDSQQGWDQERGAIEQEVAQDLSNPAYVLYAKLRSIMFRGTTYAHDALGTRPSFDKTTATMLKSFHDAWYAPNNAVLIIVGDVDTQGTLAKVRALFGGIKSKQLPQRPSLHLQPVKAQSFSVDTDRPVGTQMIAVRVPGLDSPDFPALEVLADVLSSHRFDLYGLAPQGKALDVEFALDPLPQAGMAYTEATFATGTDPKGLERQVRAILTKVARNGVPADLVDAAKRHERSEAELQKNSIAGSAEIWSDAVTLYGLHSPEDDLVRIEKVTVADVNRVARRYLDLNHAVTAVMVPHGSGRPTSSGGGFGGQENIALGEGKATSVPDWAQAAEGNLTVPDSTTHPSVMKLANGVTLIVQPETVSDTVSVYGYIRNRPEMQMPAGREGVSHLLDLLLSYGSEHLDRLAFEQALDAIGAHEQAGSEFSLEVLAADFDRGVELLADNELHPALPAPELGLQRAQFSRYIGARNRSPGHLADFALRQSLFPKTDPTLREPTPESVNAISIDDVRSYYRAIFRPDLCTIVVIGNITPQLAQAAIERFFGSWTAAGPAPALDLPTVPPNGTGNVAVPDDSRVQDEVALAQNLNLTRSDPDYYALNLGSAVLGGSFYSTRLSIDLRKDAGLVYGVGSQLEVGRTRGVYLVRYACDPQNVSKAQDIVIRDLKTMQTQPVSDEELRRVKALLLQHIPLSEASTEDIAMGFLRRRDLDLPLDEPIVAARRYVELQAGDVQRAFQKWLRPDDLVRVTQGPGPK